MPRKALGRHTKFSLKLVLILLMLSVIFVIDIGDTIKWTDGKSALDGKKIMVLTQYILIQSASIKSMLAKTHQMEDYHPASGECQGHIGQESTESTGVNKSISSTKTYDDNELITSPGQLPRIAPLQRRANRANVKTDDKAGYNAGAVSQKELNKVYKSGEDRVAYLTFDDGPTSKNTPAILDILAKENIKATFFVIGAQVRLYPEIVIRQYKEGHGIGNHTYTHAFKRIYKNTDNYLAELHKAEKILQSILDTNRQFRLTRFPGGSHDDKLTAFREHVVKEGFVYIDWNCQTGDAETKKAKSKEKLVKRFRKTAMGKNSLVILMHDSYGKKTSVEALPEIIDYLKQEGYSFELLPGAR